MSIFVALLYAGVPQSGYSRLVFSLPLSITGTPSVTSRCAHRVKESTPYYSVREKTPTPPSHTSLLFSVEEKKRATQIPPICGKTGIILPRWLPRARAELQGLSPPPPGSSPLAWQVSGRRRVGWLLLANSPLSLSVCIFFAFHTEVQGYAICGQVNVISSLVGLITRAGWRLRR